MKREEAMHIMQMYKDEIGQRFDKADAPDLKDAYQWQMDVFDMAIKALQGDMYCPICGVRLVPEDEYLEPTHTHGRLIDADALMKELSDTQPYNWTNSESEIQEDADYSLFKSLINSAPTVQADRPHGEWIVKLGIPYCNNCEKGAIHESDFCPNCGADMRGGK